MGWIRARGDLAPGLEGNLAVALGVVNLSNFSWLCEDLNGASFYNLAVWRKLKE